MGLTGKIDYVLDKYPGKKFGRYRFLPFFFVSGAAIEYAMIHWKPNGINFYERYKAKTAHEEAVRRLQYWEEIEQVLQK